MKNLLFTLVLLVSFNSFGQTSDEYFNSGYDKDEKGDYYGAIADYTKAIELNPNYAMAYINRGNAKLNLKDYYGVISDSTRGIELDPNYSQPYRNRGISKEELGDLNGACDDWKKAAKLGDTDAGEWVSAQCN